MATRYAFDGPFAHLGEPARQRALDETRETLANQPELWVFGYGSLLWRPCFDVVESRRATVANHAVGLNVWTVEARGTPAHPGLGLGLLSDPGSQAHGAILNVHTDAYETALNALWEREMLTGVYQPKWLDASVDDGGQTVRCLGFCVDPNHPQAAPALPPNVQARLIASARGVLGPCVDYVRATAKALSEFDIPTSRLDEVLALAEDEQTPCMRG